MTIKNTRRGNNEGCITKRKNGTWAGVATIGYDENHKQIRKYVYGKTKSEAQIKLQNLTHRVSVVDYQYTQKYNFGDMMKQYMLTYKMPSVTSRTFEHQFRNAKLHIINKIGNMHIEEVNSFVIQNLLNSMLQTHSLATIRKIKYLLNQFFNYAVEAKLCLINPVLNTKVKSGDGKKYNDSEKKYKAIPISVRNEFLEKLNKNPLLKSICYVMFFNGLRIGETLGLKWKDVDFENRTINIQRALTYNAIINNEGNVIDRKKCIGDTKTAGSVRLNLMCEALYKELKIHYDRQKELSQSTGKNLIDPDAYIFCFNDGSLRTYDSVRSRLNRFLKSNNLEQYNIHPHTLRHTFSNSLMENKLNPKIVQRLLGHKSVSTTLKIYNSIDDDMLNESVIILDKLY